MKAEKGANTGQRRNILVGIRFDSQGRELLSWAIVKVADSGDQVTAVHVCRKTDDTVKKKVVLDDFLDSYRDLCNIKKINLVGQILKGNSIRKSLMKEANICHAVAVVVGTSNQAALAGWLSAAKYCTKHLPSSIEVLGIHNGKAVFRRSSSDQKTGRGRDPRPSIRRFLHFSSSISENQSELGDSEMPEIGAHSPQLVQFPEDGEKSSLVPSIKTHSGSSSLSVDGNLDQKPGWPLLRKSSLSSQRALQARKMSVVQWVMNLPSRSPPKTPQSGSSDFCFSVSESPLGMGIGDSPDNRTRSLSLGAEIPEDLGHPCDVIPSDFTWFSYEVLKSSTSQFSSENLIGKGGCSRVYKGRFPDGRPVAVKVTRSSKETWKDFSLEIDIISSLKHKNITPLLGVCIENSKLISVYEFMSKGSLEDNLHGDRKEKDALPWKARFKIAVGIADALNYLHNGCSRTVIHRDVKSSNILISDGFEPKLSDFGLAIWGPSNSSSETYNDVVGTFGYLAPEYFMYGKVSDKADVYSFGVVLLELLSGKKPIDSSKGQESLVMWAKPVLESGKVEGILDPKLEEDFDESQMRRMILAATLCLTRSARLRPHMNQILKLLRGEETIDKWTNSYNETYQEGVNDDDDEVYVDSSRKSHLSLLDVEDDFTSISSMEQNGRTSLEDYLRGLWSRSSSFD